jgi:hypothetical protein
MIQSIRFSQNLQRIARSLGVNFKDAKRAGMIALVEEIEARGVKHTPVRTGELANSENSHVNQDGSEGKVQATAKHARFVHDGTGIYGPKGKEIIILPKKKKALFWPGGKHPVKKVVQQGIRPNPFFKKALKEIRPADVFERGVKEFLKRR